MNFHKTFLMGTFRDKNCQIFNDLDPDSCDFSQQNFKKKNCFSGGV